MDISEHGPGFRGGVGSSLTLTMFAMQVGSETRTGKRRELIELWTSIRVYQPVSWPAYCGRVESGGARIGCSKTGCVSRCLSVHVPYKREERRVNSEQSTYPPIPQSPHRQVCRCCDSG